MAGDAGTIFAVSSGAGRAGIAVIRLSGPNALEAVTSFTGLTDMLPRKATRVTVKDPESGEPLDDGLVLVFPHPKSFTGEDVAELHVHGSRAVLDDIIIAFTPARVAAGRSGRVFPACLRQWKIRFDGGRGPG